MKPKEMTDALCCRFCLVFFSILVFLSNECLSSKISDLRLCGDKECKSTLSYARTLANHRHNDPVFLSFERNAIIEITSKSAGERPDLWGGRINGKTGYFPRSFVREYKVEIPTPQFILSTRDQPQVQEMKQESAPPTPTDKKEDDTDSEDDDETEVEDEDDEDNWWEEKDKTEAVAKMEQKDDHLKAEDTQKVPEKPTTSDTESDPTEAPETLKTTDSASDPTEAPETLKTTDSESDPTEVHEPVKTTDDETAKPVGEDKQSTNNESQKDIHTLKPAGDENLQNNISSKTDMGDVEASEALQPDSSKTEKDDPSKLETLKMTEEKKDLPYLETSKTTETEKDPTEIETTGEGTELDKDPTELDETEVEDKPHKEEKKIEEVKKEDQKNELETDNSEFTKQNKVDEKLAELTETLHSLHEIDDQDKSDVDELNKLLQTGAKSMDEVKKADDQQSVPMQSKVVDVPTQSKEADVPTQSDSSQTDESKSDEQQPNTKDSRPREDVVDETEIGEEGSDETPQDSTDKSPDQSVKETGGQEIKNLQRDEINGQDNKNVQSRAVTNDQDMNTSEHKPIESTLKSDPSSPTERSHIHPSSVMRDIAEDSHVHSSFTSDQSTVVKSEQNVPTESTPELVNVPASVIEGSTTPQMSHQTQERSTMPQILKQTQEESTAPQMSQQTVEGFTIIDGTPFPLEMFDDAAKTQTDITQTKENEPVVLTSTPISQATFTESIDSTTTSSLQATISTSTEQVLPSSTVENGGQQTLTSDSIMTSPDTLMTSSDTVMTPSSMLKEESTSIHQKQSNDVQSGREPGDQTDERLKDLKLSVDESSGEPLKFQDKQNLSVKSDEIRTDNEPVKTQNVMEQSAPTQKKEHIADGKQLDMNQKKETVVEMDMNKIEQKLDDKAMEKDSGPLKIDIGEGSISDQPKSEETTLKPTISSREQTLPSVNEQTTLKPTTSPREQLMSSMESELGLDSKKEMDKVLNTATVNILQPVVNKSDPVVLEMDRTLVEAPSNVDAYATADFLSRKPLSHEPSKVANIMRNENPEPQIKEGNDTSGKSETQVVDETKGETVTQAPAEGTSHMYDIPPPPTEETKQFDTTPPSAESDTTKTTPQQAVKRDSEPAVPPHTSEVTDKSPQPTGQSTESKVSTDPSSQPKEKAKEDSSVNTDDTKEKMTSPESATHTIPQEETTTADPYSQENIKSRKINDEKLEEEEDAAYRVEPSWLMSHGEQVLKSFIGKLPPSVQTLLEQEPLGLSPQMTILVSMVTTVTLILVTCCTCGDKRKSKKQDPVMIVRSLEEKLFIMTKEKENLEDELSSTKQQMEEMMEDNKSTQSTVGNMQKDIQTLQLHNNAMKEKIETMEEETSELRRELSQKSKQVKSTENQLTESQKQNKAKEEKMAKSNERLKEASKEVQDKSGEIKTLKSQVHSLSEQVEHLQVNRNQLTEEAVVWSEKVKELTEQLEYVKGEQKQMSEDLAYKENEIEVLRDCFLQLKSFQDEETENEENEERDVADSKNIQEKLKAMMDVSEVTAKLKSTEEEKDSLQNRLDIEMQGRRDLEEQILALERKAENLQSDKMKLERQYSEAQTKMDVLSSYFKQKEVELQRELGEQEALKKININKLENSDTRTKMMQEELESSKSQIEDLKREILSAERDFRSQIAANEKKAHENWLSARAAERELKESKHDASVLRQKLTDLERRLMQGPPGGLIRPVPSRGMPPPGMINGPPLPGMDRPGSRGGRLPHPNIRDDEFPGSPGPDSERRPPPPIGPDDRRGPPPPMGPDDRRGPPLGPDDRRIPPFDDRRMPFPDDRRMPPPMDGPPPDRHSTRVPPPHMDGRSPPPFDRRPPPPLDRRSPPPYDRGLRMPPPPLDRRSPGHRMPFPPDFPPHLRGPPPPRGPLSPSLRNEGQGLDAPPYRPQQGDREPRQQSQV